MNVIVTGLVKLYFAFVALGVCTTACAIPSAPLLVLCEMNQMKTKDFHKNSLWAIAFCIIAFSTLAAGLLLTIAAWNHPYISNLMQSILGWISSLQA